MCNVGSTQCMDGLDVELKIYFLFTGGLVSFESTLLQLTSIHFICCSTVFTVCLVPTVLGFTFFGSLFADSEWEVMSSFFHIFKNMS